MTIEEFAEVTRRVIAAEGFDGFQPTALFPGRDHLALLADIPTDVDVSSAAIEWALEKAQNGEDVIVAFKVDDRHFRVVQCTGGNVVRERDFEIHRD